MAEVYAEQCPMAAFMLLKRIPMTGPLAIRCHDRLRGGAGEGERRAGRAVEVVRAALLDHKPRRGRRRGERAGPQRVVRRGRSGPPGADGPGGAADIVAADLALTGVQPAAHLD